jgi:hypothetical protein
VSWCRAGAWGAPSGGCWLNHECKSRPGSTPGVASSTAWSCGLPAADGTYCDAACGATGYTGYAAAMCNDGVWNVTRPCTKATAATKTCIGKPTNAPPGTNAQDWDNCYGGGTSWEGGICRASCKVGFVGFYASTCVNGTWTAPAGTCRRSTGSCASPPPPPPSSKGADGDYQLYDYTGLQVWDDGTTATAYCPTGMSGSVVTVCTRGAWSAAAGACFPASFCPFSPPRPVAAAGQLQLGSAAFADDWQEYPYVNGHFSYLGDGAPLLGGRGLGAVVIGGKRRTRGAWAVGGGGRAAARAPNGARERSVAQLGPRAPSTPPRQAPPSTLGV